MKGIGFWLVLLLPAAISALDSCPREIVSCSYTADRMEAITEVRESIVHVFSNVFGTFINSSNDMELYEVVSSQLGINATADGFVQFQEAVNEITSATASECSKPISERITLESVAEIVMNFSMLLDEGDVSEAREIYGKLLCLNSTLDQAANTRKRRQSDRKALDNFFKSLDGEHLERIFNLGNTNNGMLNETRPALAFVVDNTGSMVQEIEAARRLIRSFIRIKRSRPSFYIYTTFNDPDVGIPMKYSSTNLTELQDLVRAVNNTNATGGGDCAELGMTGILNALNLSSPDSNVIVLTDAAAKDVNLTGQVIKTAKKLRNAIHFFISTPFCENVTEYLQVANATNGIVVNTITEFENFTQFVNSAAIFNLVSTSTVNTSNRTGIIRRKKQVDTSSTCIQFVTNIFTTTINLLVRAPGSIVNITTPSGEVVTLNISGSISSYSNNVPQPGWYEVCSDMGDFEYALSIPTALDFFVEYLEDEAYSTQPPPDGTVATVTITTSRLADISLDMPIRLSLIDTDDGMEISTVPLMQCGEFLTGSLVIPNTTFQYQLRGTDIHGFAFEHMSNHLVDSTPSDERSLTQLECPTPSPSPTPSLSPIPTLNTSSSSRPTLNTSPTSQVTPRSHGSSASTIFMPANIINSVIATAVVLLARIM